jgi:hypothetical protein
MLARVRDSAGQMRLSRIVQGQGKFLLDSTLNIVCNFHIRVALGCPFGETAKGHLLAAVGYQSSRKTKTAITAKQKEKTVPAMSAPLSDGQ